MKMIFELTNFITANIKLIAGTSFLGMFAMYFPIALLDLGLGLLIFTRQKYKFGNVIWSMHKTYLLLLAIVTFCVFEKLLLIFLEIFYLPIILLVLAFVIRQFSFTQDGKYNRWHYYQQIRNFLYCDSSFVILITFGALIGTIIKGTPFYFDNSQTLTSLFSIQYLFSFESFLFVLIMSLFALNLAFLYYCIGKSEYRNTSIISQTILTSLFLSANQLPNNILIGIQIFSIYETIKSNFKFSFILNITNILCFFVALVWQMFPFILPSSLEPSQHINVINYLSDIDQLLLPPIMLCCLIFWLMFWHKLLFIRNVTIQKDDFYILIVIASVLMIVYFLSLSSFT